MLNKKSLVRSWTFAFMPIHSCHLWFNIFVLLNDSVHFYITATWIEMPSFMVDTVAMTMYTKTYLILRKFDFLIGK